MRARGLKCIRCNAKYPLEPLYNCQKCQGILEVYYNPGESSTHDLIPFSQSFEFMPILKNQRVTLGEGNTSLVKADHLAKRLGLKNLFLKCETSNPTGSFKDRPVAVGISKAVDFGYKKVVTASSGNGAAAVAAYAARAGLDATVLVPESTPIEKVMQTLAYGAKVIKVEGPYSNCFSLAKKLSEAQNFYNITTTFYNPYTVEGDKLVGYELFENLQGAADAVFVPIGAGPLLVGIYKGYLDYKHAYPISKIPKMVGVQAEGNNPIVQAFREGSIVHPENNPQTIAGGIADGLVGYEQDGDYTLKIIRESQGYAVDASDERILEAKRWLAVDEGLFVEPSAAAAIAGLVTAIEEDRVGSQECIVAILTGHGLKDIKNIGFESDLPLIPNSFEQLIQLLSK